MKKKILTVFLSMTLAFSINNIASAVEVGSLPEFISNDEIKISIDGNIQNIPSDMGRAFADTRFDRIMLPLRFVSEKLGYEVTYEKSNDRDLAIVKQGNRSLIFTLGSNIVRMSENGKMTELVSDAYTFAYGDRTYVPIRYVSEYMGLSVDWDQSSKTVLIDRTVKELDKTKINTAVKEYTLDNGFKIKGLDITEQHGKQILDEINKYRLANGLNALSTRDDIEALAEARAKEQTYYVSTYGALSHEGANDRLAPLTSYGELLQSHNFNAYVAYHSLYQQKVLENWQASKEHNNYLLDKDSKYGAVGVFRDDINGKVYISFIFSED